MFTHMLQPAEPKPDIWTNMDTPRECAMHIKLQMFRKHPATLALPALSG